MHSPEAKTVANDLIERISAYSLDNLLSEFESRRLLREADKLKNIDFAQGWMISGIVYSLIDDYDSTINAFQTALKHPSQDYETVLFNYIKSLDVLGRFDEAYEIIKESTTNDNKKFIYFAYKLALKIGRINEAITYRKMLEKFPSIDFSHDDYIHTIINCCQKLNIKDDELHNVYLLVLESIHLEKRDVGNITAEIDPVTGNTLILIFHVNANAKIISSIEWSIVEKLAQLDLPIINSHKLTPIIKSDN